MSKTNLKSRCEPNLHRQQRRLSCPVHFYLPKHGGKFEGSKTSVRDNGLVLLWLFCANLPGGLNVLQDHVRRLQVWNLLNVGNWCVELLPTPRQLSLSVRGGDVKEGDRDRA